MPATESCTELPLPCMPDDTAIARLAPSGRGKDDVVQRGVQYLERLAPTLTAPWSLAWSILAFSAHPRPITLLHRSLVALPDLVRIAGDTSTLALACLALDYGRTLSALASDSELHSWRALIGSAALAAGTAVTTPFLLPKYHSDQRPKRSRVAILNAQQYSHQLDQILDAGLRLFP